MATVSQRPGSCQWHDDDPWWAEVASDTEPNPWNESAAAEPPPLAATSLAGYLAAQAAWYRFRAADETDPLAIMDVIASSLEDLYQDVQQRGLTSTDSVRAADPLIGSDSPRGSGQSDAGVLILDEVHHYRDQGTEAADLVADVLVQVMHDVESWGSLGYSDRLSEIRHQRRRQAHDRDCANR